MNSPRLPARARRTLVVLLAVLSVPCHALAQEADAGSAFDSAGLETDSAAGSDGVVPSPRDTPEHQTEPQPAPTQPAERPEPNGPWRAHAALGLAWLRFQLDHQTRFEHLENDFRAANPGNATGVSMRTLLSAELRFLPVVFGAELQDSRAWATDGTPLNTTIINPLELLQVCAGLRAENLVVPGDAASLTVGRITMDLGSRRLVARNQFRNTINAFTGLDLQWTSPRRDLVRTFVVMPVIRLPAENAALAGNRVEIDRENTDAVLWGAFVQSRPLAAEVVVEGYVLGLHEADSDIALSSNRQLFTPGVRAFRAPTPGSFDFQIEVIGQFGSSRASTAPTDVTDLNHLAMSLHASGGYRFAASWAPRLVLQYDFASGDGDPGDGTNGRFDPLFGARRFDFGPTGLYGAFARSNMSSPGLRFEVQPHRTFDAFTAYRLFWLASSRDTWIPAGLRDARGAAGSFVGHQLEARVRWHVFPGNLSLDVGGALLVPGEFAKTAPGGDGRPSFYVYTQLIGTT